MREGKDFGKSMVGASFSRGGRSDSVPARQIVTFISDVSQWAARTGGRMGEKFCLGRGSDGQAGAGGDYCVAERSGDGYDFRMSAARDYFGLRLWLLCNPAFCISSPDRIISYLRGNFVSDSAVIFLRDFCQSDFVSAEGSEMEGADCSCGLICRWCG